jgi:hypothetical protein
MTQPLEFVTAHAEQYERARDAQTELANKYLAQPTPELSLAATACHRALQFERQAAALREVQRNLEHPLPAPDPQQADELGQADALAPALSASISPIEGHDAGGAALGVVRALNAAGYAVQRLENQPATDPLRIELAELLEHVGTREGHTQQIHADTIRSLLEQYPTQPATASVVQVVALSQDPADRDRAVERVALAMHDRWTQAESFGMALWRDLASAAITELEQSR